MRPSPSQGETGAIMAGLPAEWDLIHTAMKAVLNFTLTVLVTLLFFAAFTYYVFATEIDLGPACALPVVCG